MVSSAGVTIQGVTKKFGSTVAVNDVSLEVPPGAFMTLLGPSGCGKTTLLRMAAGLEKADAGKISVGERVLLDAQEAVNIPPRKRGVGLVFQSYALWPHMTVRENVDYGLRIKRLPSDEIDRKVREVLKTVGMVGYEQRYPNELSGGQQQRVSPARMLVMEPALLLMDEPLSNLDAKLRLNLRAELKRIHQKNGYVPLKVYTSLDSGPDTHMYLEAETGEKVIARDDAHLPLSANETVYVCFPEEAIRLYDSASGELLGRENYLRNGDGSRE